MERAAKLAHNVVGLATVGRRGGGRRSRHSTPGRHLSVRGVVGRHHVVARMGWAARGHKWACVRGGHRRDAARRSAPSARRREHGARAARIVRTKRRATTTTCHTGAVRTRCGERVWSAAFARVARRANQAIDLVGRGNAHRSRRAPRLSHAVATRSCEPTHAHRTVSTARAHRMAHRRALARGVLLRCAFRCGKDGVHALRRRTRHGPTTARVVAARYDERHAADERCSRVSLPCVVMCRHASSRHVTLVVRARRVAPGVERTAVVGEVFVLPIVKDNPLRRVV